MRYRFRFSQLVRGAFFAYLIVMAVYLFVRAFIHFVLAQ